MRAASLASVPLTALLLSTGGAAWAQSAPAAPVAAEAAVKLPAKAVCAVCGPREHSGPEAVAASLVYNGKTYYFCQEACRSEFRQEPEKWLKLAQESQNREGAADPKPEDEKDHQHGPAGAGRGQSAAPS